MANYAAFIVQFSEFRDSDPTLVNAFLNAAILEVDASACGVFTDQIIYYTAAQSIALSPSGNTSKLVNKDGSTVYDTKLDMLQRKAVGAGPRAV